MNVRQNALFNELGEIIYGSVFNPKRDLFFSGGHVIPAWLSRRTEILSPAKHCYAVLVSFSSKDSPTWSAYPDRQDLADALGIRERTVSDRVAPLRKHGLIYVKGGNRRNNEYQFLVHPWMHAGMCVCKTCVEARQKP